MIKTRAQKQHGSVESQGSTDKANAVLLIDRLKTLGPYLMFTTLPEAHGLIQAFLIGFKVNDYVIDVDSGLGSKIDMAVQFSPAGAFYSYFLDFSGSQFPLSEILA